MSTKSTIVLTKDNECVYSDGNEHDNGKSRVYIEIAPDNLKYLEINEDGFLVGINGDCELA